MINRIDIVSIPVNDQQAAKAFYCDVLGFKVKHENPMGPDQTWVQLELEGADTHAKLSAKGIEVSPIDKMPWGDFAMLSDPDGNGLVLQQAMGG